MKLFEGLSKRGKIIKNFFSLTTAEAFNRLASLIYLPFIARIFGPEGLGKVHFAECIVAYFMLGANFGFDVIGAREIARSREDRERAFANMLLIEIAAALVSFSLLCVFTYVINKPTNIKILILLYGLRLITFAFMIEWFFIGLERMGIVAVVRVVKQVCFISFILLTIKTPDHLYRLPLSYAVANVLVIVILFSLFFLTKKRPPFKIERSAIKHLCKEIFPLGSARLLNSSRDRIAIVFLGFMKSVREVGFYSVSFKLLCVADIVPRMLYRAIFPNMTRFLRDRSSDQVRVYIKEIYKATSILALPLGFFVWYNAEFLVNFIFGREFQNGIIVLQIISWNAALKMYTILYYYYLIAIGQQKKLLICSFLGLLLNIALCFYFISLWNIVGAALAFLISGILVDIGYYMVSGIRALPTREFFKVFIYFLPSMILSILLYGKINSMIVSLFAAALYVAVLFKMTDLKAVLKKIYVK